MKIRRGNDENSFGYRRQSRDWDWKFQNSSAKKASTLSWGAGHSRKHKQRCETLEKLGLSVEPLEIDVSNSMSIQSAVDTVNNKHDSLDVLVNNAGVLLDYGTPISDLSVDNLRDSFETNFFGAFETTQAFLPLIRKSACRTYREYVERSRVA